VHYYFFNLLKHPRNALATTQSTIATTERPLRTPYQTPSNDLTTIQSTLANTEQPQNTLSTP